MARFLAFGDGHISDKRILTRPRLPVCMSMMTQINEHARRLKVDGVFALGDLIDLKSVGLSEDRGANVLHALWDFFESFDDVPWYWLRGNHESPDRENPEKSIMRVFHELGSLQVVRSPRTVTMGNTMLFLIPWYEPEVYKGWLTKCRDRIASQSLGINNSLYLLTHVGLQGGREGGIELPSDVSAADLFPSLYKQVILGDYHTHQVLRGFPNVWYTGSPITHSFGEDGPKGVWLVDTDKNSRELIPLNAPRHCKWAVMQQPFELPGYVESDYNQIRAPRALCSAVERQYPSAQVVPMVEEKEVVLDTGLSRLSVAEKASHDTLVDRWLTYKGIDGEAGEVLFDLMLDLIDDFKAGRNV